MMKSRWLIATAGAALIVLAWAIFSPLPAQDRPECVTYNMGVNRLSEFAEQTGWIINTAILTPNQTDKFYGVLIKRGMSPDAPQAHQVAFVWVDAEPETIGGLLYDQAGCVLPPRPIMPRGTWVEMMTEALDGEVPVLKRVRFSRGA